MCHQSTRRRLLTSLVAAAVALAGLPALAQPGVAVDAGPVLELVGPNSSLRLDRTALEAMGAVELTTRTPWGEAEHRFRGVPLARVLAPLGGRPHEVEGSAINDYKATIALDDPDARYAFLAFERDGQPMRIRDKGPFWIVFPWSQYPELDNAKVKMWSIWQLREIRVAAAS